MHFDADEGSNPVSDLLEIGCTRFIESLTEGNTQSVRTTAMELRLRPI